MGIKWKRILVHGILIFATIMLEGAESSLNYDGREQQLRLTIIPSWCQPKNITCRCGRGLKTISIPQCLNDSSVSPNACTDCELLSYSQRCSVYQNCKSCSESSPYCHTCPVGKCGAFCDKERDCKIPETSSEKLFNDSLNNTRRKRKTEIHCPKPTDPAKGKAEVEFSVINVGDAVKYSCDAGFTMMGSHTRHCNGDGRWAGERPTCEKLCAFPVITNQDGMSYVENPGRETPLRTTSGNVVLSEIEFSCQTGYTLRGPVRIRCTGGEWDRNPPQCVLANSATVSCPAPRAILDGQQIPATRPSYESGTFVSFKCNTGFRLVGQSFILCTDSGVWSSGVPTCQVTADEITTTTTRPTTTTTTEQPTPPPHVPGFCPRPLEIKFGNLHITILGSFSGSRPENMFEVGASVTYSCKHPYELQGQAEHYCLASGRWSGQTPECRPVCGKGIEPKTPQIVGGRAAVQNGYPWQVALTAYMAKAEVRSVHCGGAVLNERWVLTAAHCVTEELSATPLKASFFLLFFGKHFVDRNIDDNNVISRQVAQLVVHPKYNPWTFDNDIALIMLESPLAFTAAVLPICLPSPSSLTTYNDGQEGVVTGWGYIASNGTDAKLLMSLELPIVNSAKCENSYQKQNFKMTVTDNMFCAGVDEGGKNTCQGDSGGAMAFYENGRYVMEGIVSWGNKDDCAAPGFYGGFVRVRNFIHWISLYIGQS